MKLTAGSPGTCRWNWELVAKTTNKILQLFHLLWHTGHEIKELERRSSSLLLSLNWIAPMTRRNKWSLWHADFCAPHSAHLSHWFSHLPQQTFHAQLISQRDWLVRQMVSQECSSVSGWCQEWWQLRSYILAFSGHLSPAVASDWVAQTSV